MEIIKGTTHGEYTDKFPSYTYKAPVMVDFIKELVDEYAKACLAKALLVPFSSDLIQNQTVKLMDYEIRIKKDLAEFWAMPTEWTIAKEPRMFLTMDMGINDQISPLEIEHQMLRFILGKPEISGG